MSYKSVEAGGCLRHSGTLVPDALDQCPPLPTVGGKASQHCHSHLAFSGSTLHWKRRKDCYFGFGQFQVVLYSLPSWLFWEAGWTVMHTLAPSTDPVRGLTQLSLWPQSLIAVSEWVTSLPLAGKKGRREGEHTLQAWGPYPSAPLWPGVTIPPSPVPGVRP